MQIRELARRTGVSTKTIRYYEAIGLLPPAPRSANNYRVYDTHDVERLQLIASARHFDFSLGAVATILASRDRGQAPCTRVLDTITQQIVAIDQQIAALLRMRADLADLRTTGLGLPQDDVRGEACVCALLKTAHESGHIRDEEKELPDE